MLVWAAYCTVAYRNTGESGRLCLRFGHRHSFSQNCWEEAFRQRVMGTRDSKRRQAEGGWAEILREAGSFDLDPAACPLGRLGISRRGSDPSPKEKGLSECSQRAWPAPFQSTCSPVPCVDGSAVPHRQPPSTLMQPQTAPVLRTASPPGSSESKAQHTCDLPWEPRLAGGSPASCSPNSGGIHGGRWL